MMNKEKDFPPPIQQLLIAHWQLAELSTGKSLSDGASEQSLREEILYYYNGSASLNQWTASSPIEKTREAISFNGLCKALYEFPNSFVSSSVSSFHEIDSTREVYLGDHVLIFVLIETQSVVAIVQASRTVTPSAVRASLSRSHGLFCLLRGGGIHRRLCSEPNPGKEGLVYSQLEPIYRLWKEISREEYRKLRTSDSEDGRHFQELIDRVDDLYEKLSIIPLRRDLRIHYDAYVGELNQLANVPNMLRRLTDEIPIPVYRLDGAHAHLSLPLPRHFEYLRPMQDAIGKFLKNQDKDLTYMLHVCCIYDGKIMFRNGSENSEMSHETVLRTWNYMQHIRLQMLSLRRVSQPSSRSSTPTGRNRTFPQLMLSLGKRLEDAMQFAPGASHRDDRCYLAPPPLALLSTLDKANGFKGPSEESMVWCLPVSFVCQRSDLCPKTVDAYASMYCWGDASFLLFWKHGNDPKSGHPVLFFRQFEATLLDGLHHYPSVGLATTDSLKRIEKLRQGRKWHTEGVDIIFIDRERGDLILFTDPSRQLAAEPERSSRSPRRPGNSTPPKPHSEHRDLSAHGYDHFDCRHLLAVNLPSEVILCLEDALEKVNNLTSETLPFETCTFSPKGWVYVLKDKKRRDCYELYIIFDVGKFVTLTDVEIAAREIRRNIFSIDEESGKL